MLCVKKIKIKIVDNKKKKRNCVLQYTMQFKSLESVHFFFLFLSFIYLFF